MLNKYSMCLRNIEIHRSRLTGVSKGLKEVREQVMWIYYWRREHSSKRRPSGLRQSTGKGVGRWSQRERADCVGLWFLF